MVIIIFLSGLDISSLIQPFIVTPVIYHAVSALVIQFISISYRGEVGEYLAWDLHLTAEPLTLYKDY